MISKGSIINERYEIIKSLGEGGMANVYLAKDILLNREVALKMLRGDLANEDKFIKRFQREALALSSSAVAHPNIVQMYDLGEEDNNHYIVMEYIKGETLKQLLNRRGSLTLTEAVDIMIQLTSGIMHAHNSYIIHRDLKPQNIMIEDDGLVKITDFGIAMALNSAQMTQTNSVMGSVHYLPPEQASGHKATIKSDIYSLGIMFYELLTGELPFKGENAVEIALKHMKKPMPSARKINENIPQSVENIIFKATAKNPKNRYNDVKEMYNDLKVCLNDDVKNQDRIIFKYPESNFDDNPKMMIGNPEDPRKKEEEEKIKKIVKKEIVKEEAKEVDDKKKDKSKVLLISLITILSLFLVSVIVTILIYAFKPAKDVKVPNVTEMTVEEAKDVLKNSGFKVSDKIEQIHSPEIEKGKVIKTDPLSGKVVKEGRVVTLWESLGEEKAEIEDYVGKNVYEVKTELEKVHGLKVEIKKKEVDDISSIKYYTILEQEPKVGSKLSKGDKVVLYIPDILEKYPDFVKEEWTLEKVREFAKKYELNLKEEAVNRDGKEGLIVYQSRKAGSPIEKFASLRVSYISKDVNLEDSGEGETE